MDDIRVYKLTSSQEIIGRLTKEGHDDVSIKQVRVIEPMPTPNGISVAMFPFMLSSDDNEIVLNRHAIAASITPSDIQQQLKDMYIKQTTGIEIAPASSIVGR